MLSQTNQPLADGLSAAAKGQSPFDDSVSNLTWASAPDEDVFSLGIVINNGGSHAIVAFSLQWLFDDGAGQPLVKEKTYFQYADRPVKRSNGFSLQRGDSNPKSHSAS
jgi:hypothetical protein